MADEEIIAPKENNKDRNESERQVYKILPTGMPVSDQYSDISMTNLVGIFSDQISSERQTIWQRYAAMLVANSLIFGFLVSRERTKIEIFSGVFFGIVLCIFWLIISIDGWKLHLYRRDEALKFVWTALNEKANPFQADSKYEKKVKGGRIYQVALWTIWLFIIMYIVIAINYGFFL